MAIGENQIKFVFRLLFSFLIRSRSHFVNCTTLSSELSLFQFIDERIADVLGIISRSFTKFLLVILILPPISQRLGFTSNDNRGVSSSIFRFDQDRRWFVTSLSSQVSYLQLITFGFDLILRIVLMALNLEGEIRFMLINGRISLRMRNA
jgi:hypothetical protein